MDNTNIENQNQTTNVQTLTPNTQVATETVTVSILDYTQKITCRVGEGQSFIQAAQRIEKEIKDLHNNAPTFSRERLAILVALDICHDLIQKNLQLETLSSIIKDRSARLEQVLNNLKSE